MTSVAQGSITNNSPEVSLTDALDYYSINTSVARCAIAKPVFSRNTSIHYGPEPDWRLISAYKLLLGGGGGRGGFKPTIGLVSYPDPP